MKLYEIKSQKELEGVMLIWYKRTIKLRDAWQNSTDDKDIAKAFRVFMTMYLRLRQLIQVYVIISQSKKSNHKSTGTIAELN